MGASVVVIRAAIGLAQGLALYLLYDALQGRTWPSTQGPLFAAMVLCATFVPTIAVAGWGNLRPVTFAIWIAVATAVLAGLGAYDILRDPVASPYNYGLWNAFSGIRNLPGPAVWLAAAAIVFIAHALIVAGDADRRLIPPYARYFDIAWKHAVQVVLVVLFLGAFWLLLWLGSELFRLIRIEFLATLIRKQSFAIPASTLAIACAIHVTDVHTGIVRGVRTLKLTLQSWLLPLMALMVSGFLVALLFTGLEPLWSTRRATAVLLLAAGALILLTNTAYQDGQMPVTRILRYAATVSAIVLVPLGAIAAYAVMLRVGQYGWTPERIIAMAGVLVACWYALGYAVATVVPGPWFKWAEPTNLVGAYVILAILLALFSPLADPARLATLDQVARLKSGRIAPEKFDYAFLRFRSGIYGRDALERLRTERDGPDATRIAELAAAATAAKTPMELTAKPARPTPADRAANITLVYPKGETLPASFLRQDWAALPDQWRHPRCMAANLKCDAVMVDLDGDGTSEIVILSGAASVYRQTDETWRLIGTLAPSCKGVREALLNGEFAFVAPQFKDLQVAGQRLQVQLANSCR